VFIVDSLGIAILFCVITMLGWGSWANTQKLAGKDRWPFELYYWDYAIGVCLLGLVLAFTIGSTGDKGMGALANLQQAEGQHLLRAFWSGVLFNISNILLVVAINSIGMAVAFPVGVGLALVLGTVTSYFQAPKGDPTLLFGGVVLVVVAMVMSAIAHGRLPRSARTSGGKGIAYAVIAGCLMGFFYPQLMKSISADFRTAPIHSGYLTPYVALLFFGLGLLASNFVVNTIFMRAGKVTYSDYFRGRFKLHLLGVLGGFIWMLALGANVLASGVAGPAVSYALGQGATLVAAIWGVLVWKEFKDAPRGTTPVLLAMFAGYVAGLALIGVATL